MTFSLDPDSFNPQEFISQLVKSALDAGQEAEAQAAALAAVSAEATRGDVRVMVGAGGVLTGFELSPEASDASPVALSKAAMEAYREAADRVNQLTAGTVSDPAVAQEVLRSVPADIQDRRTDDVDADARSEADHPAAAPTVDDLPPDPEFDKVLAVLEAPDPMAALRELDRTGQFDMVDLNRPREEIDREITGELEAISARAQEVQPELRALRETADNKAASVSVGAWGAVSEIALKPEALRLEADEASDLVMEAYREASDQAARAARAVLSGAGLDDPDDPTLKALDKQTGDNA